MLSFLSTSDWLCPWSGDTLSSLRNHVAGMNPENKGLAIGKNQINPVCSFRHRILFNKLFFYFFRGEGRVQCFLFVFGLLLLPLCPSFCVNKIAFGVCGAIILVFFSFVSRCRNFAYSPQLNTIGDWGIRTSPTSFSF